MKTTKRLLAVVLAVMMVVAMVPVITASAATVTEGGTEIKTFKDFRKAIENGGTYQLMNNINVPATTDFNVVAADTTIIGNNYKIGRGMPGNSVLVTVNENVTFNAQNVVFDGGKSCLMAITTKTVSPNGCTINLTDCTVQNFSGGNGNRAYPAVYYFGDSKGTLTNCTFQNNKGWGTNDSGADIWAGAATDITISGGTYSEIFANGSEGGSKSEITLLGDATVEKANCIVPESIVPVNATVAGTEYNNVITTVEELEKAAAEGGTYQLDTNLTVTKKVEVAGNLKLISTNGATITCEAGVSFYLANDDATLEMTNITLDGNNTGKWGIFAYKGSGGKNYGNIITLNDCNVQNFKGSSYVGAIYSFGACTTNLNNCTFTNNTSADPTSPFSGSDVWAGAASTVNINGGTVNEVYGNADSGGFATYAVNDNATVGVINLGSVPKNTATATIADTATVGKVNIDGKEAILTEDNQIVNTGGKDATPDSDDAFAKLPNNKFTKSFELIGVQTKAEVNNSLRFVSVISSDLLNVADDYGYIVGTTKMAKADAMANAANVTVESAAKFKVSCNGTSNSVYEKYGDCNTDTNYKYVTAAVEGITDTTKTIFARVYVTIDGKTYYGDYINGTTYAGCATSLAELG